MRLNSLSILLFCLISGCVDTVKVAPSILELGVLTDIPRLELGRELYVSRCTKCHNALRITRYSKAQWVEILPDMTYRSKFTIAQTEAVTAYIQSVLHSAATTAN
jgi:hypothetical protein